MKLTESESLDLKKILDKRRRIMDEMGIYDFEKAKKVFDSES
jgi:hypothetical protein